MEERELRIESDDADLAGALSLPSGREDFPVVLMLHGSGPLDRNENMRGQRLDVFNVLAVELAGADIGSLRYDKRGCGESSGLYHSTGHVDLVDDAVAWYDAVRRTQACTGVFALGHSEGCLIAAELSLRRPGLAGLVLLCPFVETMESILLRQARQLDEASGFSGFLQRAALTLFGRPVESQKKLLRKLRASSEDSFRLGLQRVPAKWLRELLALDAGEIYSRVECPALLVAGEKDLQCDPEDVDRIAELVSGTTEVHRVRDLTHVLRRTEGPPSFLGVPKLLAEPMDPHVSQLVVDWVSSSRDVRNGDP